MTGPLLRPHEIPPLSVREVMDHYIQCGPDHFLGPSGNLDDRFNHSCDPNAGLFFEKNRIFVRVIKRIPAHTEVCIDYSTVMTIDPLLMKCYCGTKICRGTVEHFRLLPSRIQSKYIALGIVPDYAVASCVNQKPARKKHRLIPVFTTLQTRTV